MVGKFNLYDLRTGMVVKIRGSEKYENIYESYVVMRGIEIGVENTKETSVLINANGWIPLGNYSVNLQFMTGDEILSEFDIMEVYTPRCEASIRLMLGSNGFDFEDYYDLLWKREEPTVEMTIAEIEKKLGIRNLKVVKEHE